MLVAKNSKGRLIKILDSVPEDTYICPICGENLIRKFGVQKQYYAHPMGVGDNCEAKVKLILKDDNVIFTPNQIDILNDEYYNKKFYNIKVELSDYLSEEGYYLTNEQKEIIFATEDRIKISALAGAAKSSTLYYYAKERPYKKILYVVYNKSMKDEGSKIFNKLNNVEIKTMHGLAYKYVGVYYKHKLTNNYNAVDVIRDLNMDWTDQEIAVKVYAMFKEYMLSDAETFEELEMFNDESNKKYRPIIIELCKRLWQLKKDYHSNVKVEHDFYMKLFQLSKLDLSSKYDIILIDEVQDASMLILDILTNSNVKGIVMVGDGYQSLYLWRKAVNIMPMFDGKEYFLTTSFRVSQNIANIANLIIQDCSDNEIHMKGFNTKQKIVDKIDKSKPYACLCRTNAYIFSEVIEAIENGKKALFFEGGYSGYNFNNILDGYYFYMGHTTKNPIFSKFENYNQMEDYAEKNDDLEIKSIIKMINNYGSRIPNLIDNIKHNVVKYKIGADVIFSTVHRAKGQTYVIPVLVADDHFDIEKFFIKRFIEHDKKIELTDYFEEMAILYVSITRCADRIQLSDKLKQYLITRYNYFKS